MRGDMVSETQTGCPYANQVARAIVQMDDRLSKKNLVPCDLPTIRSITIDVLGTPGLHDDIKRIAYQAGHRWA